MDGPKKPGVGIPKLDQVTLGKIALQLQKREESLIEMEKVAGYSAITVQQTYNGTTEIEKVITSTPRPASVIEFEMDSKGKVKPRVKIYHEDPVIAMELAIRFMEQAKQKAIQLSE